MKKYLFFLAAITLLASCQQKALVGSKTTAPNSILSGSITNAETGQPVAGAFVYVYKETNTHFFGPPNYMSRPSDDSGAYSLDLPPGKYYIMARKRQSGDYQGPLHKADYFSESETKLIKVSEARTVFNLAVQKLEGQQFYRPEKFSAKTDTFISGRILDQNSNPVFGAIAFAYKEVFHKGLPPDYGSVATDVNGRYSLYLDNGGTFVVGARINLKEPPTQGELVGFYKQDREKTLSVPTGNHVGNIDITLVPFAGAPQVKPVSIPMQR